jgi:pilin/secretion family protein with methylation motif
MVKTMRAATDHRSRTAFTLIEVMVTLALTMLMMAMFASIFQIAGNFVTRQKGIGENDQSARILTTTLKTDLQARTMRILAPFHPNMPQIAAGPGVLPDGSRRGYFYYSENNPADDTDDVLQFTIDMTTLPSGNPMLNARLPGLATFLPVPWEKSTTYLAGSLVRPASTGSATGFVYKNKTGGSITSGASEPPWNTTIGGTTTDGGSNWTTLASPLDQPDGDDGVMIYDANGNETANPAGSTPNNTGASPYAEVSYFLRHGNLIRRVNLIRQPYDLPSTTTSSQPLDSDTPAAALIPGVYPPYPMTPTPAGSGNFWSDFDYAARIQPVNPAGTATGVRFLGTTSAENSLDNTNSGTYNDPFGSSQIPIGRPDNRFGHDQAYINDGTTTGVRNGPPREFDNNTTSTINGGLPQFFGRYTQEETSNTAFLFPGNLPSGGSPVGWTTGLTLDSTKFTMSLGNPASTSLAGGSRRGEDILLTNVVSFDVKILDPTYKETVNNVDVNRNGVIDNGPAFADVGHSASGSFQASANVLSTYGPTPNVSGGTPSNNNVFDTWYRWFNFDNTKRMYDNNALDGGPGPAATTGILYAPAPYRPRAGNTWAANTTYTLGTLVDPAQTANGYVYLCTNVTGTGQSGTAPTGQLDPFSLQDTIGSTIVDGGVTWTVQQPLSVQAIQITVKYLDPTQNLLRQVTIVQSLTQ